MRMVDMLDTTVKEAALKTFETLSENRSETAETHSQTSETHSETSETNSESC